MSEMEGQMALFTVDGCEPAALDQFAEETHCTLCPPDQPCPHCPVCNTEDPDGDPA